MMDDLWMDLLAVLRDNLCPIRSTACLWYPRHFMPYLEQCLLGVSHETLCPTLNSACLDYLCSSPVADFNVEFQYFYFIFFYISLYAFCHWL